MDKDNFKPPQAELGDPPRKPGSLLRALLTGAAIEIGGTLVLGIVLGLGYGILLGAQGYGEEEMKQILSHPDPFSSFGIAGLLLGGAISVFAGYACAAIAHRRSYAPVFMLASISVCLGLLLGGEAYAWHWNLLLSLLTVACVLFGGWLHQKDLRA